MKTTLSLVIAMAIALPGLAQWTTSGNDIYNSNVGSAGIGTSSPAAKLHIYGANFSSAIIDAPSYSSLDFRSNGTNYGYVGIGHVEGGGNTDLGMRSVGKLQFASRSTIPALTIDGAIVTTPGWWYYMGNGTKNYYDSALGSGLGFNISGAGFATIGSAGNSLSGGTATDLALQTFYGSSIHLATGGTALSNIRMTIGATGNVGIGTTDPQGYKLAVNGNAIATSMKVKMYANWPDFVFKKDYKLPTLTEVKSYVDKNQHLPDMPSADEVHANGLDLGEMNRLLLKKVEELTLYLIEKDGQIAAQNAKDAKQEVRIMALEKALKKLTDKNK